jgi:hypothetical protein
MDSKFHGLQWFCFLLLFFTASCGLVQIVKKPEGERTFPQETSRLEKLAQENPESSVRAQSHLELASLCVDHRNPQLNYSRKLQEMQSYLSLFPNKPQTVDFLNWLGVLKEWGHLRTDKIELIEKNRALLSLNKKLQNSLESVQETNRNLGDEVASLRARVLSISCQDTQ